MAIAAARHADAVYAVGGSQHICVARAQMKLKLPDAYFLATDGVSVDSLDCITDAADAHGMYMTLSDVDPRGSTDVGVRKNVDAYRKKYPKASDVSILTFASCDCARILIDAITRATAANPGHIPTRLQVLAEVAQTHQFQGVTGTYSFDGNGDATSPLMSIYQAQSTGWVYMEKIDAGANQS